MTIEIFIFSRVGSDIVFYFSIIIFLILFCLRYIFLNSFPLLVYFFYNFLFVLSNGTNVGNGIIILFRYLPNKRNIQIWRLEKEINSKILKLVKQCQEKGSEQFLLQTILEGAKNCEGSDGFFSNSISQERFIIDNCKSIFFAGHDTTAITSTWCLVLLAKYQDWQDRARAEVLEVCRDGNLDASNLRKMKTVCFTPKLHVSINIFHPLHFILIMSQLSIQLYYIFS